MPLAAVRRAAPTSSLPPRSHHSRHVRLDRAGFLPGHHLVFDPYGDRPADPRRGADRGGGSGQQGGRPQVVLRPAHLHGGGSARRQPDVCHRPVLRCQDPERPSLVVGLSHARAREDHRRPDQEARHHGLLRGPLPRRPAESLLPHGRHAAGEVSLVSAGRFHLRVDRNQRLLRPGLPVRRPHHAGDPVG